jgi:hypothetical protein
MNLIATLAQLGFKPEDYTISGDDFSMNEKSEERFIFPTEFDEEGNVLTETVDITPVKPSPEQLQSAWEEVQLKECDIALLINEYLIGKDRDSENDSLNIANGLLHSFNFTHVEKPTNAQLLALKSLAESKASQKQINEEAEKYLKDTDYLIIREVDCGTQCPAEVKALRQAARNSIIR